MGKVIMSRSMYRGIPIWKWGDLKLIRLGKGTFITVKPVEKNVRTLGVSKYAANRFAATYNCQATIAYDTEWEELCNYLKVNFATKEFVELNKLDINEALLLNSETNGDTHILAAGGENKSIGDLFHGFISGDDSDGEPQPIKVIFLTLRFDPNDIVIE